jgi:hypothetical protein
MDKAIDRACAESDGSGLIQSLLNELIHARQKYGHIIDGKKRARGRSAEKRSILPTLKYAAAWAYEFVSQEWEKAPQDRYIPLQKAEERFNTEREHPCHDPIEMAAFLVLYAYKDERMKHNIKTPWDDKAEFSPENFARRYTKTEAGRRIHARVQKTPALLSPLPKQRLVIHEGENFQEALKTACQNGRLRNPLLQKLFALWTDA